MELHPNAATDTFEADGLDAEDVRVPHRMATDRLVLRRTHPEEVEFDRLHALFADANDSEDVFELCGWDAHEDEVETREYLDDRATRWERGEFYEYVLESVADGEYVGTTCLDGSDDGAYEFGLWLRKPYWGRGLGGEQIDALVHVAFERLDAPFVTAGCLPENDRSRRAIEKFVRRYGGSYYGSPPTVPSRDRDDGANAAVPHHEWVITRDQYASGDRGLDTLVPGVEYGDLDL